MSVDLFTGTWLFEPAESRLSSAPPLRWLQHVVACQDRIIVREEITRATGMTTVEVDAIPDGKFYPVTGSPIADEISYLNEGNAISGTGRKNGKLSFRETLTLTKSGCMTINLCLLMNGKELPLGIAHFKKQEDLVTSGEPL